MKEEPFMGKHFSACFWARTHRISIFDKQQASSRSQATPFPQARCHLLPLSCVLMFCSPQKSVSARPACEEEVHWLLDAGVFGIANVNSDNLMIDFFLV